MGCNTLKNITKHFMELGYLKNARLVPMEHYENVRAEMARLQGVARKIYNVNENLFDLEMLTRPTVSYDGTFSTFRLNFDPKAFKVLDAAVEEANAKNVGKQIVLPFMPAKEIDIIKNNTYRGTIFETKQEMEEVKKEDLAYMPSSTATYNPTNYNSVVSYKERILKNVEKRLAAIMDSRRYENTDEIRKEIAHLNTIKTQMEKDLELLKNDPDIFARTMAVFNNDIALVQNIFANGTPTIENIHFAESIIKYFEHISDYSANNPKNGFVNTSDIAAIEPDVKDRLNELKVELEVLKSSLQKAKQEYLLRAIDKSQQLKALFPGQQLEEIRDELLADKSDIGLVSMLFGTVEESFAGEETLLSSLIRKTLEDSRNKNKSFASGLIQNINYLQDSVKKRLIEMGYGLSMKGTNSLISEVSYDLFYQKTANGNKTGRLINRFSHKWFSALANHNREHNEKIRKAFSNGDPKAVAHDINQALVDKFNWLNSKADFIDLRKMPEILANPHFSHYSQYFNAADAHAYKQELISKIGEYEYNKLVQSQTEMLEDYATLLNHELDQRLLVHGVSSVADLPAEAIHSFNIFAKRHSPFEFMNSLDSNQGGRVDYNNGSSSAQYQSHLKYNLTIPKSEVEMYDVTTGTFFQEDSGYFDKDFDKLDADLMKFWEVLNEAATYMNGALAGSNVTLGQSSLLRMSQSTADILLNNNTGVMGKSGRLLRETGQTVKDLFSANENKLTPEDLEGVSKGKIQTIQEEVESRFKVVRMQLGTALDTTIESKSTINLSNLTTEALEILEKITGKKVGTLAAAHGINMRASVLKEYLTNQVMEEQTFNLPVMMRAYLDMVSEYKAQKEALPEINILKDLYDNIKVAKKEGQINPNGDNVVNETLDWAKNKAGIENRRWKSQVRMRNWVNKNVKGTGDNAVWGKLFGWKNYTAGEQETKKITKDYIKNLESRISRATDQDEIDSLNAELSEAKYVLDNLGSDYALSAIYDSVINRTTIFVGLSWNVKAQVINRFQGWWQGMINDTGRYWTEGNFNVANAFINRKGLRYIPGAHSYRNEIRKTRLMIEKLNALQDATNELDRAKRDSGIRGKTKVLNPFYLTEYVEWHNQVPQILSILMDKEIKDKNGNNPLKVFDGSSFPAFTIKEGHLVLRPEYDTEENRATWVDFTNQESSDNKSRISQTIAMLNGDYSKTGGVLTKSTAVGKTLMAFKTWLPKQFLMRFGRNQTDLALGRKGFDGAYVGALGSNATSTAASAVVGVTTATLATMGLGLGFGALIGGGLFGYSIIKNAKAIGNDQNLDTLKQLAVAGRAILHKSIGMPVNMVSGKNIIKAYEMNELNMTQEEKENLKFIINEMVGILYLTLVKIMIKAMMGDGEEDEPKEVNEEMNPYYYMKLDKDRDKSWYNVQENTITKMISDVSLFYNPAEVWNTIKSPAGLDNWMRNAENISDGIKRTLVTDNDVLTSGPDAGESKLFKSLRKTFLPSIINEWSEGDVSSLTFGTYKDKEFNNSEVIDNWFKSDYALDKKAIESTRASERLRLTNYWREQFEYDEAGNADKVLIDEEITKLINEELQYMSPSGIRFNYDENQKRIEEGEE